MSRRGTRYRAFTLIELLVVVMIIFMLSGMLFTVSKVAAGKAARAGSVAIIERMSNALVEFYAEYGIYPPVSKMTYEREQIDEAHQPQALMDFLRLNNDPGTPENPSTDSFFPDTEGRNNSPTWPSDTRFRGANLGYRYGLVSYLWPRRQGAQWPMTRPGHSEPYGCWYDTDTDRDVNSKAGWASYLEEVTLGGGARKHASPAGLGTSLPYWNEVHTVSDSWGHVLEYRCLPPYTSFKLWSVGPDGADGTADDVGH